MPRPDYDTPDGYLEPEDDEEEEVKPMRPEPTYHELREDAERRAKTQTRNCVLMLLLLILLALIALAVSHAPTEKPDYRAEYAK